MGIRIDVFLFCNDCRFVHKEFCGRTFFVTDCRHTFCNRCAEKMKANNNQCELCKAPCRIMEINETLHPDYQVWFMDIKEVGAKCLHLIQRILDFQQMHRDHWNAHVARQLQKNWQLQVAARKAKRDVARCQQQLHALIRERDRLRQNRSILRRFHFAY